MWKEEQVTEGWRKGNPGHKVMKSLAGSPMRVLQKVELRMMKLEIELRPFPSTMLKKQVGFPLSSAKKQNSEILKIPSMPILEKKNEGIFPQENTGHMAERALRAPLLGSMGSLGRGWDGDRVTRAETGPVSEESFDTAGMLRVELIGTPLPPPATL